MRKLHAAVLLLGSVIITAATDPMTETEGGLTAHLPVVALARDGTTKTVKPLDDRANPYRYDYAGWDEWMFAHFDPLADPADYRGG